MKKPVLLIAALLLPVFVCFSQTSQVNKKDLKKLAKVMAGTFSSLEQSLADSAFFHVVLHMKPVWRHRTDGHWLYVEQAMAQAPDKPYRQRIYHLYLHDSQTIVSKVYEMENPMQYAGAWQDPTKLGGLAPDALVDRQGCGIFLKKTGKKTYAGATPGNECLSVLRGAAYATSEVEILPDRILSWDRGWDKDGKQVWGAVKGGYVFKKEARLK